jgi:hypothetical protein
MNKSKILLIAAGVAVGGILGYLYYYFVGCDSGNCSITSNPYRSSAYGMLLGGLASDILPKKKK